MLSGPLKGKSFNSASVENVNVNFVVEDHSLHIEINKLWDLDTVGSKKETLFTLKLLITSVTMDGDTL